MKEIHPTYKLEKNLWRTLQKNHEDTVSQRLGEYFDKRDNHIKDPVLDFMFEYYRYRSRVLRRWSPGMNILLEDATSADFPDDWEFTDGKNGRYIPSSTFPSHRRRGLQWVLNLQESIETRPPMFGCFGMHEWAMVYRSETRKHNDIPLRFSADKIAEIVEERPPLCTHYDAYRFFTPAAAPLNKNKLHRESPPEFEQAGCLHTNMDLYKWSGMFYPWISSEFIWKCFSLAVEIRTVDMKASPYDLREFGLSPIKIETVEGRKIYKSIQEDFHKKAIPLRKELIKQLQILRDAQPEAELRSEAFV